MGTFGRWLTDNLKGHQMSRADLAATLDVTEQTIYAWIKGKTKPTDEKLDALTELFKAERADVYFYAGKGYAGVEHGAMMPEFAEIAMGHQDTYLSLTSPAMRKWYMGLVRRKLDEATAETRAQIDLRKQLKAERGGA